MWVTGLSSLDYLMAISTHWVGLVTHSKRVTDELLLMGFVASSGLFFMANDEHSIARSFSYIAIKAVFFNGYLRYGCTYSITGVGITDLLLLETSSILPRSQPFRCSLDCSGWWLDFRIGPPSPIYRPRCERLQQTSTAQEHSGR